ncbi:cellular retinoic acid-binding protein 1 isoform X2 [Hyperolius riggenbachi]|uniref:cellular retinoic acid-binding protein 1 isoform X2 n=1 Tax=Hyperolius riggenbachi TaxID=752182 RepID=UPI0035A30BF2
MMQYPIDLHVYGIVLGILGIVWLESCGVNAWTSGVNAMLRKVAGAAASKPHVEIRQSGDQFYIKTSTTVRTTEIQFTVGKEFDEETVDGRKCKSFPVWEKENKIYCKQTLVDGTGPKTYWTRELIGDELILVFGADDVVCTRIYVRT